LTFIFLLILFTIPPPPRSTLFPYTTLFRSRRENLANLSTASLLEMLLVQCFRLRPCFSTVLQLFRQLEFTIGVVHLAQFAIRQPEQMMGNRIIRIHGEGAL